ncbi:hypothetical protein [Flavobacterium sp. HNIBRBA15423]|uniref:hypothetical protein n=1 Tax=Flavobacterium sp. HNIBRBA15423 TaxID=3458683 RepID=UPI0040440784
MRIVLIYFFLFNLFAFSQEKKVVDLLNKQLMKEIKKFTNEDSLKIIQPFYINESKKLILEFEKYNSYNEKWEVIKSEVSLDKITGFIKDINVIFQTEEKDVLETIKTYNEKKELISTDIIDTNLFFTGINKEQNNTDFRDKIVEAFKKAGYVIDSQYWYD